MSETERRIEYSGNGRDFNLDIGVVGWFSKRMLCTLYVNSNKPHWDTVTTSYLISRLREELGELEEALLKNDTNNIINECTDVANFAMMIADKTRSV